MSILYTVLVGIVVATFWTALNKLMRTSAEVTPMMGWVVGLLFFVILPLAILVLNGGYDMPATAGELGDWAYLDLSDLAYFYPFMVIWTSLMFTAVVVRYVAGAQDKEPRVHSGNWQLSVQRLRFVILVCSGLAIIDGIFKIMLTGNIQNYFELNWYSRFEQNLLGTTGSLFVLYLFIGSAVQVILTAAAALLTTAFIRQSRDLRYYGLLLFTYLMMAMNMVLTGNRVYIALFALYCATVTVYDRRFRLLFIFIVFVPLATTLFSAWGHIRGGLGDPISAIENYQETKDESDSVWVDTLVGATEAANVMLALNIIKDFGSRYDFLFGETYSKAVTFLVPRSIYPSKIDGFTVITARLYAPGVSTSLSSTVLGEMYANFGIFAVLLLPAFTLVIDRISRWVTARHQQRTLFGVVLFLMLGWIARSIFSDNFLTVVFAAMIITGLHFEKGIVRPAVN